MGKILAISNQKGGVGKTTTVNALASVLRHQGRRVLCVDCDPQGNLSFAFGADADALPTIYSVLRREVAASSAVQTTRVGPVIPCNILLSEAEMEFTGEGREFLLRDALAPIAAHFDYVLLDSPPGLGFLTVNAFTAADALLIPLLPDIYSLQGIARIFDTVEHVRAACNPRLTIAGAFLCQFYPRQTLSREVGATAKMIARELGFPLLRSWIRRSVTIAKAQTLQQDILDYAPLNGAVQDYVALTDELLQGGI